MHVLVGVEEEGQSVSDLLDLVAATTINLLDRVDQSADASAKGLLAEWERDASRSISASGVTRRLRAKVGRNDSIESVMLRSGSLAVRVHLPGREPRRSDVEGEDLPQLDCSLEQSHPEEYGWPRLSIALSPNRDKSLELAASAVAEIAYGAWRSMKIDARNRWRASGTGVHTYRPHPDVWKQSLCVAEVRAVRDGEDIAIGYWC